MPGRRQVADKVSTKLNPLKKMQSLMAVADKLIRVFYAMLTKGVDYDPKKMVSDIKRPAVYLQAAQERQVTIVEGSVRKFSPIVCAPWKMMVSLFAPFTRRFHQGLSTASANLDLL